jgi:hypothetical protein
MTIVLICLLSLGSAVRTAASPADSDSRPIIVLRGVLESKKASGPPGWNETTKSDRKVMVYVLKLPMPAPVSGLDLPADSRDVGKEFQELQLVCDFPGYPECAALLKKSINHPIRVVGQTSRPAEPAERLPVIMHVRLITVLQ